MARRSQRKGKRGERECVQLLRTVYPEAHRRPHGQAQRGDDAPDVDGTPFWVESKCGARPDPVGALRQGLDATDGRPVLVMHRRDRGEMLVTMRWEDFAHVLAAYALAETAKGMRRRDLPPDVAGMWHTSSIVEFPGLTSRSKP